MFEVSGLSKRDIQEEYEDLVFRKVMAIYVENESRQILAEIKAEKESNNEPVDTKVVEKLYDKKERRENLSILWKYSKKVVSFAAMIVFVAIVSLSSAVVAFADVREAVVDALYHLIYEENERYTQVAVGESTGFIDPENYYWDGAYAPTYIPNGYLYSEIIDIENEKIIIYSNEENEIIFSQSVKTTIEKIDTEGAEIVEKIIIGDSEGLFVVKGEITSIFWSSEETLLSIVGNADSNEMKKMAEGIKILK